MVKHPGICKGAKCRLCDIAINKPEMAAQLWGGQWAVYSDLHVPTNEDSIRVVVTANGLGDHVLGLVVLPGLVKKHPTKRIIYQLKFDRYMSWVKLFETSAEYTSQHGGGVILKPHDSYNRQLSEFTSKGRHVYYAEPCGVEPALPTVRPFSQAAINFAKPYAGRVLLCPWSAYKDRHWSLAHWLELEKKLIAAGYSCLILDDQSHRNEVFTSPKLIGAQAEQVAAVMMTSPCIVGIDSGLAHVAGMLRRPTIVIAGQIQPEKVFGIYPTVRGLMGGFACDGCHWRSDARKINGCQSFCFSMGSITPDRVLQTVQELTAFPRDRLAALWTQRDETNPHENKGEWLNRYAKLWEVVRDLKPKSIVEIGVRAGYSSWTMLEAAPGASLHGIDFDGDSAQVNTHGGYKGAVRHAEQINIGKDFHLTIADSHTLDKLPPSDLVFIDGDHTEQGCYQDLELAERSGATWILCDDYSTPEGPDFGVKTAITKFCQSRRITGKFYDNGSTGLFLIPLQPRAVLLSGSADVGLVKKKGCGTCQKNKARTDAAIERIRQAEKRRLAKVH